MTARSISRSVASPFARSIVGRLATFTWTPALLFAQGQAGLAWQFDSEERALGERIASSADISGNNYTAAQAVISKQPRYMGVPTDLAPNIAANPRFTQDSDWTKGSGWVISGGSATKTAGVASSLSQSMSLTEATGYAVFIDFTRSAGTLQIKLTGGTDVVGDVRAGSATHTEILVAEAGNVALEIVADAAFEGSVTSVVVRPITATAFSGAYVDGLDDLVQSSAIDMTGTQSITIGVSLWRDARASTTYPLDVLGFRGLANAGSFILERGGESILGRGDAPLTTVTADGAAAGADSDTGTKTGVFTFDYTESVAADQASAFFRGFDHPETDSGGPQTIAGLANGPVTVGAGANGTASWRGIVRRVVAVEGVLSADQMARLDDWLSAGVARVGVLSDSTWAANVISSGQASQSWNVGRFMADVETNSADVANPGDEIALQKTAWAGVPGKFALDAVIIQLGVNDCRTYSTQKTSAQIIAELQNLVDTVRADIGAGKKIYLGAMLPAKAWFDNATDPAAAYQHWLAINEAIDGGGATPITGVDRRVNGKNGSGTFWQDLNDGSDNLLAAYDHNGDGVHQNNEARWIVAQEYRKAMVSDGLL